VKFLALFAALSLQAPVKRDPPRQPIPYSHKQHLALGLKCQNCHTNPDPGEMMGIPAVAQCMTCHRAVKTDSPAIQKLTAHARDNREPPWVRVYQVPSYVFFSHRAHREAGAACETCHGQVSQRDALWREGDISMGGCMDCHRKARASIDCAYCHEARQD
jgi:cytochrome c7-like protein/class III cytochrome C family protein